MGPAQGRPEQASEKACSRAKVAPRSPRSTAARTYQGELLWIQAAEREPLGRQSVAENQKSD
jgi:hypothetical protein